MVTRRREHVAAFGVAFREHALPRDPSAALASRAPRITSAARSRRSAGYLP
jgi:hypothetical protein